MIKNMRPVATMSYGNQAFSVRIDDVDFCEKAETIYIWTTTQNEFVRIGTSKAPLKHRLANYAVHLTNGLRRLKEKPTSYDEALKWERVLVENGNLIAYAHQPNPVTTFIGDLRPYLDIERTLIAETRSSPEKSRLLLNRSHR